MRKSGTELLRLVAAMFVVVLHYNDKLGFVYVDQGSLNWYVLYLFESIAICAVNLFLLISGYYQSMSNKRTLKKPFCLLLEVCIFQVGLYSVHCFQGRDNLSISTLFAATLPANYFMILYCALYLISPYFNYVMEKLEANKIDRLMILLCILFSVYPTAVDLLEEILGKEIMGLSSITAWGNFQGFNITHFSLMYFVGSYIRLKKPNPSRTKLICVLSVNIIFIFCWSIICERFVRHGLRSAWVYHNPLVILLSVVLFLLFYDLDINNRLINNLASASFTSYLIHPYFLTIIGIEKAVKLPTWQMVLHVIICIPLIYLMAWIIHKAYTFGTGWIFKRLKFRSLELV